MLAWLKAASSGEVLGSPSPDGVLRATALLLSPVRLTAPACTREVARESILVEEHSAMVLGDHVEVLRQGTGGDETRPLLYANRMPRAIEVRSQHARNSTTCVSRVAREDLQVCLSAVSCAGQTAGPCPQRHPHPEFSWLEGSESGCAPCHSDLTN